MSLAAVTPTPPTPLPKAATPAEVAANNAAFQNELQTYASEEDTYNTFPTYLTDTFLTASTAPAPNPFGTTLPGLALATSGLSATPATPNPFAQHGLGINVSALR